MATGTPIEERDDSMFSGSSFSGAHSLTVVVMLAMSFRSWFFTSACNFKPLAQDLTWTAVWPDGWLVFKILEVDSADSESSLRLGSKVQLCIHLKTSVAL